MRNAMTIGGQEYTGFQTAMLVLLRILVGWHFMYEGLAKIVNPYWTSAGYLAESQGWFSGIFHNIAAHPTMLTVIDYLNAWGLLLIGIGLLFGLFTRTVTVGALVLLFLYYIAAPPFVGYTYSMPTEGSYLIVNKVLIELVAVAVLLAFPTGKAYGLDRFIGRPYAGDRTSLNQAGA